MAGVVQFYEKGRNNLAKTLAIVHWLCIIPSFICLLSALYIQVSIEDKIFFIENYNGAILPGVLVFTGFFGLFTHILSGKVTFSNSKVHKRKKWAVFLLPVVIVTFVIFVSELVSGIMCFIHVADLGESFDAGIRVAMAAYRSDASTKEQMDVLQMSYDCCGSKGHRDWFHIPWIHTDYITESKMKGRHSDLDDNFVYDDVPFSCCNPAVLRPCIHHHVLDNDLHYNYDHRTKTTLHTTGCTDRLMIFYENSVLTLIGAVVLSLSFIELFTTVGCRYLQTAIQGAMDADDHEGPSSGYLFMCGKGKKGMDETATTEETTELLDTTAETKDTLEESFDGEERYVQIFSDDNEPAYENVPPFKRTVYDEAYADGSLPPPPEEDDEHIYHDSEVEEYLASRYAASREKFDTVSITPSPSEEEADAEEPTDLEAIPEEPIYENLRPIPSGSGLRKSGSRQNEMSGVRSSVGMRPSLTGKSSRSRPSLNSMPVTGGFIRSGSRLNVGNLASVRPSLTARNSRAGPSLTEIKSNHGSYMSMNISNSSVKTRSTGTRGPFVHRHLSPSPVSLDDSQPYVINIKSYKSPSSPVSPPRLSRRKSGGAITPHVVYTKSQRSQHHTYPPRLSRPAFPAQTPSGPFSYTENDRALHSPRKRSSKSASAFVPFIYNTCTRSKRGDSPAKGSPEKRVSPEKMEFRSGVSYECNHSME